ncbi:MAG: hypothetical protein J7J87_02665 [Candidatus Diapherotrites archaeon]|nr:hypothetical protein [Candidatus Diapherotrites archaeon]
MVSDEEIKKLVLLRLETMPANLKVSLGSREFSRDELIEEVKKETELGKIIMKMQLEYLRAMKRGFE